MTTLFTFLVMLAFAAVWALVAAMLNARAADLTAALAGGWPRRVQAPGGNAAVSRAFMRA